MVVPLYTRTEHVIVEQVMTRDRMPIQSFEFFVFHKADAGPEEERVRDRGLFFNRQILATKVWSTNGNDWRGPDQSHQWPGCP